MAQVYNSKTGQWEEVPVGENAYTYQPGSYDNLGSKLLSAKSAYDSPPGGLTDKQNLDVAAIGQNPLQYQGTFNQAFTGLGQQGAPSQDVIASGTRELADSFIDRILEKTGKLPDANQVKDFVSSNLDSSFASQYIKGALNRDQIKSQIVDPYMESKGLGAGEDTTGVTGRMNDLSKKLEQYYGGASQFAEDSINREYNKQKINVANDIAGSGQSLSSPATRYSLNDLEGQRGVANANAQAQLASQKAGGQVDISKTIENIMAGQRSLQQGASQFGQQLQFSKNQYQNQQDYQNRSLGVAQQLGMAQANANKKGPLDYLNTSANLISALAKFTPYGKASSAVDAGADAVSQYGNRDTRYA